MESGQQLACEQQLAYDQSEMSKFYDGDTLCCRNSKKSHWPFVKEVVCCNSSSRSVVGVGLIVIALHTVTVAVEVAGN